MGLVMLGKQQGWKRLYFAGAQLREFALERVFQKKFFLEPYGHRGDKRTEPVGCIAQIGLKQTFEFDQWFVVEDDGIQVGDIESAFFQTILDGMSRKTGVVFLAGK